MVKPTIKISVLSGGLTLVESDNEADIDLVKGLLFDINRLKEKLEDAKRDADIRPDALAILLKLIETNGGGLHGAESVCEGAVLLARRLRSRLRAGEKGET